jgi:RNA polymerase sigma-70 factor (ECF subfamily)
MPLVDVEAARGGDRAAFERLAAGAIDGLYAIACLMLRDPSQADDAVQETLVRAWVGIARLREPERFEAWLHRLLVHACTDQVRGRRRFEAAVRRIDLEPSTPDRVDHLADRDALERGLRRLSLEHRAVVVFHFYLGLTVPEIAGQLGVPSGTVKSRLHHARQALRASIEADARHGLAPTVGSP